MVCCSHSWVRGRVRRLDFGAPHGSCKGGKPRPWKKPPNRVSPSDEGDTIGLRNQLLAAMIEKTEGEVEEVKEEVKALPVGHPERALLMTLQARLTAHTQEKVLLLQQAQGVVLPSVTCMRCIGLHVW